MPWDLGPPLALLQGSPVTLPSELSSLICETARGIGGACCPICFTRLRRGARGGNTA